MTDIKGIPYAQVRFDKNGKRENTPNVPAGTTDLIAVSHGWNNSEAEAEELYKKLFGNFADQIKNDPAYAGRKLAIVGVIWPAKKFDELMTQLSSGATPDAGGAKSLAVADAAGAEAAMHEAIDRAAPAFDDPGAAAAIAKLHALVPGLEGSTADQGTFVKTLRELLGAGAETAEQEHDEDSSDVLLGGQPALVFAAAMQPVPATGSGTATAAPSPAAPGVAAGAVPGTGSAQSLTGFFSKVAHGVTNLLNLSTYFEMKKRAGIVGQKGIAPLIDELAAKVERVHLVGHSFGGRAVAAAAANSTTPKLHSLALLQAAFSHNGFSETRGGFFRAVVAKKRVSGPILVTHTKNDKAVGLAYPAASRLSGDVSKTFGGPDDKFGGIGSNGAQQMNAGEIFTTAKKLLPVNAAYSWQPGKFHNLESSEFIVDPNGGDAHGFVHVPAVAWAISRAIIS